MPDNWTATVNLAGSVLSLTLFGFYTQLLFSTLWMTYWRRRSFPVMVSLTVLYAANLIDAVFCIYYLFEGFIRWPGGPVDFYENGTSSALFLAFDDLAYVLASIAADFLLLWRLYHIWNRHKSVMIFPTLSLLLNVAGAWIVFTLDIQQAAPNASPSIRHSNRIWKYIILANTVVVNVYMTGLITFRLWSMARSVHLTLGRVDHLYGRLIGAIVESGVIYTAVYAANLICLLAYNASIKFASAQIILAYINIRTAGIMPSLIVMYVNRSGATQEVRGTLPSAVAFAPVKSRRSTGPREFFGGSLSQGQNRNIHFDEEVFSPSSTTARINYPMPVGSDVGRR